MGRAPVPRLAGGRAGTGRRLYVDGHVRLYHGSQTALPKRYVSRQRLCLRGTTDYWVNDALGQPSCGRTADRPWAFGGVRSDIVPRLLKEVPGQPTVGTQGRPLSSTLRDPVRPEGYSPEFFKEMWQTHRIACITYHKHPKGRLASRRVRGDRNDAAGRRAVSLQLAERGTWIGDKKSGLWVRRFAS